MHSDAEPYVQGGPHKVLQAFILATIKDNGKSLVCFKFSCDSLWNKSDFAE